MIMYRTLAFAIAIAATPALPVTASWAQASDNYLGQLMLVPYTFCPRNWVPAAGQLLPISQYSALFSLLGTTYGGDGRSTFQLPDLRGRSPISAGQGAGLSTIALGEMGGLENTTLTSGQMPVHNHPATTTVTTSVGAFNSRAGNSGIPTNNVPSATTDSIYNPGPANTTMGASAAASTATTTVGTAGGSQPVDIRDPYLGLQWCIALVGVFPPRN